MQESWHGLKFGVLGMGRSGIGAARLITRLGGTALVSDIRSRSELTVEAEMLEEAGVRIECGSHKTLLAEQFDVVVVSPGVTLKPIWIETWDRFGTQVWSELELASRQCSVPWIAVTGSNGKTTTVKLITQMLQLGGFRTKAVGNIGDAWSDFLPSSELDLFVVEVSSFQMEQTQTTRPHVAVLLNVLENHLDRHGDIETYGSLKLKLVANQHANDFAIINGNDSFLKAHEANMRATTLRFGYDSSFDWFVMQDGLYTHAGASPKLVLHSREWSLIGNHNLLNAAAAATAATCLGVNPAVIRDSLIQSVPVEHRIEYVREYNGVHFINDSKSTNLSATLTALEAVHGEVILLFGGRPKKESFTQLRNLLGTKISYLVAFGEAQQKVRMEVGDNLPVMFADTLNQATERALSVVRAGQTVLLSPGCASYDQFLNFEERGKYFKELVQAL